VLSGAEAIGVRSLESEVRRAKAAPMHFKTMVQTDVPQGRNGKHKLIVTAILKDVDSLKAGAAIKVPLAELAEPKREFAPH
jgi:hypothetical protein